MANYQYCVAENWGKGFITHKDAEKITFESFGVNLWKVPANNQDANRWISGVAGERKTLAEAQALVDAETARLQAEYDALPADDPRKQEGHPAHVSRAEAITLTE
jgi:hypothetical protein|tara:strand:- start:904 stop:1218 length:315 start_codon:yes stop_codon:yes gene_type:complete